MSRALTRPGGAHGVWFGPSAGRGARTFVALHGWSGDHRTFDPLQAYLPADARVLSLDQPGFGATEAPEAWTYDAFCAPLLAALDREGVERATLVGNCAGAVIALELALRAPERFERLVLVDPFAFVPWYFRLLTGALGRLFYWTAFANPIGRLITNLALASKRREDTDLTEGFEAIRHDVAFEYLRLLCRDADVNRYARLEMPITILHGARTFDAVKRSVDVFEALWPQLERHELDGAGHLPIREAAVAVARLGFEDTSGPEEGDPDGLRKTRRLPDASGDAPDRPDLGYDPSLGAALQGHPAGAYER